MKNSQRSIWVNFLLSLLATPLVSLIFLIIIGIIEAIGSFVTYLQKIEHWWIIPIIFGFFPSLIYFLNEEKIRTNKKREEVSNALLLYLRDKIEKSNANKLSTQDIEEIKEELLKRFKIWAWCNPQVWKKYFPDEKYSSSLFGIVDNLLQAFKKSKCNKWSEYIWKTTLKSVR